MNTRTIVSLVVSIVLGASAGTADARTNNRSKPVLYVHGLNAFDSGVDCNMWNNMISALRSVGHTGAQEKIGYYAPDSNCTVRIDGYGSHSRHHASGHSGGSHTTATSIRHLGYHLAWTIYERYSRHGVAVDVVGHSMGGLITRYALSQTARRHADFPPYLYVEDVVTFGTPHTGASISWWCGWATQCQEMYPGSPFLDEMSASGQNPQGSGGTDWTLIGSESDGVVSASSTVGMRANHKAMYYWWMDVSHGDYMHETSSARNADVKYNDHGGSWYSWYDAPYAVRWADLALYTGGW